MRNYDMTNHLDRLRYVAREMFVWPGGYELGIFIESFGDILCQECLRKEYKHLYREVKCWGMSIECVAGCDFDPGDIICCECQKDLSAYE